MIISRVNRVRQGGIKRALFNRSFQSMDQMNSGWISYSDLARTYIVQYRN